jgi:maleate isomerase
MSYVEKTHRFGLLTPSSNTVQEPEFSAALPQTVSLHTGRVAYRDITPQEQMRCVLELESESRKLADAEVDVIVFAATAPTLAKGKGYDRELIKRMEDASRRPATTAATAFVDALARLGVARVAIGAPWSKTMDEPMVSFMQASGFEVVNSEVAGYVAGVELGRTGPEAAYELGRRDVWNIPASRMKRNRPHRVPLSGAAQALLASLPRRRRHLPLHQGRAHRHPDHDLAVAQYGAH